MWLPMSNSPNSSRVAFASQLGLRKPQHLVFCKLLFNLFCSAVSDKLSFPKHCFLSGTHKFLLLDSLASSLHNFNFLFHHLLQSYQYYAHIP